MAWLVRISISDLTPADEREMSRALDQLFDRRPDWVRAMKELSRNETKRYLRERGMSLSAASLLEQGLFIVTVPEDLGAVPERYGMKLAKALYYGHTTRIVRADAVIKVRSFPNLEAIAPGAPSKAFEMLDGRPAVNRAGRSLVDQFFYRYGVASDGPAAAFWIRFRESVFIGALVLEDRARFERKASLSEGV